MLDPHRRELARRIRASYARARRRFVAERGFALIEVVVSAALLMVVAVGVLSSIDGPSAVSAQSKAGSTAGTLAQQDQERMRALTTSTLTGYIAAPLTRTVRVGSGDYTVYSKVAWVRDAGDTDSCTSAVDDTSGDYLKLTSRVSSNATRRPVQLDSLLAVPVSATGKGSLSIQIKDQLDQPVVALPVTINGSVTQTVPTNDAGCAFFGNINSGNYTVTYSKTGWVDPNGVNAVSFTSSVTSGSTNVVTKNYAQAGTINVTVNTKVNGVTQLSPTTAVTVANASLPAGILTFPASGSTKTISNLYPFTSGYGVWAGSCSSGNPVNNGQASVPIGNPGPGGSANVTVIEPAINATVTGFAIPSGTRFVATSIASGCTERLTATFNSSGKLPDPGFPYGTYKLCADNSSYGVYGDLASFASNDPNGKNAALTYRGNGSCP